MEFDMTLSFDAVFAVVAVLVYIWGMELKDKNDELQAELRAENAELRAELRAENAELRQELRAENAQLRAEIKDR